MDMKEIKELIALFEKSTLSRLVVSKKGGEEIEMEKGFPLPQGDTSHVPFLMTQEKAKEAIANHPPVGFHHPLGEGEKKHPVSEKTKAITSPMVGTFYLSHSPGSKPLVEVGDRVKKGDTLCIIEAMKVMNEIKSDLDGMVKEVCVENAEPVEFGQSLFLIE